MADDRSLRELLLDSADDLESIVKQIIDSLLNRDKNRGGGGGETVVNLVNSFDSKQEEIRKFLKKVPEIQACEKLVDDLKKCVNERDKVIQDVEMNLKACEVALTTAMFQGHQKLKAVREAQIRTVNSETVVKLAHQISRSYSVSAPLTWQQGDPSRPFPQEHEFRNGWLCNPKLHTTHGSSNMANQMGGPPGLARQNSQTIRTPPIMSRQSGSPAINSPSFGSQSGGQKVWSPRTGYGPPGESPMGAGTSRSGGMAPNQMNRTQSWNSGSGTPTPMGGGQSTVGSESPFGKGPGQSPLISPSVKVKITGMTRVNPPPVMNVEQMSSDSSSDSASSDDDNHQ